MDIVKRCIGIVIMVWMIAGPLAAETHDVVEKSFYPYRNEMPTFEGLHPGMTIFSGNADRFQEIIDPELFQHVKTGWVKLKIAETTSFDLHPNYVKATRDGYEKVSLGDKVGQINGYVAGRPFPEEPNLDDPRAGEKLALNYKYSFCRGDNLALYPAYMKYRDIEKDRIQRTIKFTAHYLNVKHRVSQPPIPEFTQNPSNLFRAIYTQALSPYDLLNSQLLVHRSSDDRKRDNAWLYYGPQRRVRRLATGLLIDSFLGTDLMIEDIEGYLGRISDMRWSFKSVCLLLLPLYSHNDLEQYGLKMDEETHKDDPGGYRMVSCGGRGGCYPNVTWQLRKVYEVESVPVSSRHPISKRIHFMDAQTFCIPRTNIYDRSANLWKVWTIGFSHPDRHLSKNRGTGVPIVDSFSMIDVQAKHCTTGQVKGQVDPALNPFEMFTVQHLRTCGR